MKTKVLMFGTFDILHPGHLRIFRQAKRFGDILYVVIALDETVVQVKGRPPLHDQETRRRKVAAVPCVDHAILGHVGNKYDVLDEVRPDIIVLGYDQSTFLDRLEAELHNKKLDVRIIRLKPYKADIYHSSLLRKKLKLDDAAAIPKKRTPRTARKDTGSKK